VRHDHYAMGKARPHPKPRAIPLHLKHWRKYRNYSQERLAELIGTTAATISRIENGKQNWDQEFLKAAAAAFDCDPVDLLIRNPNDPAGIWTLWESLSQPQRSQATAVLEALKRTA